MNESVYLNSKEHQFVSKLSGDTFSQKLRGLIQEQMVKEVKQ